MAKGLHKNSLRKVDNPHQWMIDDARMELIQQIKAEVERRKEEAIKTTKNHDFDEVFYSGKSIALGSLLSFLSDLEKSGKPTIQEQPVKTNIVEDLKHYLATTPKEQIEKDWESLKEWDKVGPSVSEFLGWEQPVCEGLEEEIEMYFEDWDSNPNGAFFDKEGYKIGTIALKNIARHFAQWGAEHLKK